MCGGIREFESLRASPAQLLVQMSLLRDEITQLSYGDPQLQQLHDHDHICSSLTPLCKPSNMQQSPPQNNIITTRLHADLHYTAAATAPAGLAIVAAISSELVQSPSPICARAAPISPTNPPRSSIVTNEDRPRVQHSQSPAAMCGRTPNPARRSVSTNQDKPRVRQSQSSSIRPITRRQSCNTATAADEKAMKKKKSIFCSAFSPPEEDYMRMYWEPAPSADFMAACFSCKRPLGSGKDIYIYRGDRAFCSNECRCHNIVEAERNERKQLQHNVPASANSAATSKPGHCKHRIAAPSPFNIPVLG